MASAISSGPSGSFSQFEVPPDKGFPRFVFYWEVYSLRRLLQKVSTAMKSCTFLSVVLPKYSAGKMQVASIY